MSITRRRLFGVGSGLGFAGLFPEGKLCAHIAEESKRQHFEDLSEVFAYGVASGDPLQDRVILWTQVGNKAETSVDVGWVVALDSAFEQVVAEGKILATQDSDFTVKIDALLPYPGTTYYYRFRAHKLWSPIGRTRTAPVKSERIRIAVVSCSSIWSGYLTAYSMLARRADIDLIVHCGDYIYDTPDRGERRNMPYNIVDESMPKSLKDYRRRFRYYRSDIHLRAAHQQHPWAVVWDDHEIASDVPEDAIQAYFEWMPLRPSAEKDRIYRSLDYGDLLKITLLDTRKAGRNSLIPGSEKKSILGEEQFDWLKDELRSSRSQWNLLVNQVLLAHFDALGQALFRDSWGGYPEDRERMLQFLADEGLRNTIVVTGDAHVSCASNLTSSNQPVGVEFLPTSVSRGNIDEILHTFLSSLVKGTFEKVIRRFNPNMRYFESEAHGYGIVDITPTGANCEFWYVDHKEQTLEERCGRALHTKSGSNAFTNESSEASLAKAKCDPLAPMEERLYEKGSEIGGQDGDYFDGLERLTKGSRLRTLRISWNAAAKAGGFIQALGCSYEGGLTWLKGSGRGREEMLELEPGEYLRSIGVGIGKDVRGRTRVSYLRFVTSLGRTLEAGQRPLAALIVLRAPPGRHIVSFFGRSSKELIKIGPIFAPDFAVI